MAGEVVDALVLTRGREHVAQMPFMPNAGHEGRGEGVSILVDMPRSWCTAPGQNSAVDAINYHHRPRKFTYL